MRISKTEELSIPLESRNNTQGMVKLNEFQLLKANT